MGVGPISLGENEEAGWSGFLLYCCCLVILPISQQWPWFCRVCAFFLLWKTARILGHRCEQYILVYCTVLTKKKKEYIVLYQSCTHTSFTSKFIPTLPRQPVFLFFTRFAHDISVLTRSYFEIHTNSPMPTCFLNALCP